jgi:hypothetical protein
MGQYFQDFRQLPLGISLQWMQLRLCLVWTGQHSFLFWGFHAYWVTGDFLV